MRDLFAGGSPSNSTSSEASSESIQRQAQRAGRETWQTGARGCDEQTESSGRVETAKPLQAADLSDDVREDATESESAPSWIRTKNLLIKSQLLCQLS